MAAEFASIIWLSFYQTHNSKDGSRLCIQTGSKGYIEVENLTEKPIADVHEASRLYMMGSRRRSTSWTNSNDASSRSHWYVSLEPNDDMASTIYIVCSAAAS